MILSWMGYALACAGVCALTGACIDALLRHRLQRRRFVWVATMGASVLLPLSVPVITSFTARPAPAPMLAYGEASVNTASRALHVAPSINWNQLTALLWVISSVLLAGALLWSHNRMRRRMRAFRETNVDGERLLVSDDFGPALVGWWHPKIVLPVWALSLADADRRLVVSHELEHRRASDPVLAIGALIAVVLFPWNVALWWQLSRLQLAIEFDCDARVIGRLGADPFAYGNMLVEAQRYASHARGPVLAMAPLRTALGKRVQALVTRHTPSRLRSLGAVALAGGAFSAFAVLPVPVMPFARVMSIAGESHRVNATTMAAGANAPRDAQVTGMFNAPHAGIAAPPTHTASTQSEPSKKSRTRAAVGRTYGREDASNRVNRNQDPSSFGAVSRLEPMSPVVTPVQTGGVMSLTGNSVYAGQGQAARLVGGAGGNVNRPPDDMATFRARYPGDTILRSGFMGAEVRPRAEFTRPPNSR